MPRGKTIQPDPDDSFTLDDGTFVEVRGEGSWEVGRGLHMKNKYEEWLFQVLGWVVPQYLDSKGPKRRNKHDIDILKSAAEFDRALQRTDFYPLASETTSTRKRLYKDVKRHMRVLEAAVKENN